MFPASFFTIELAYNQGIYDLQTVDLDCITVYRDQTILFPIHHNILSEG